MIRHRAISSVCVGSGASQRAGPEQVSLLWISCLSVCQEPSDFAHAVQWASERSSDSLKARLPHAGHEKMIMKAPTGPTRHPTQTRPTALLRRGSKMLLIRPIG